MLTFRIAWRNIFRQKRRTVLTVLSMLGGFTLSAISIGWADGTYNRIIEMFTRNRLGHIQVHAEGYLDKPSLYKNITRYDEIGRTIAAVEHIEAWTPRLYSGGLASLGDKSAGAQVVGVDPERENSATNLDGKIIDGTSLSRMPSHEALLGKGLARILKAGPGDSVVIVSQAADGSIANDIYRVKGIIETGDDAQDRTAFYLHLRDAQELFVLEGAVHEIVVIVDQLDNVAAATEKIRSTLDNPDLAVAPWQEFARSFYVAMKTDKQGSWIMLFIVVLLVAIGVLNTVLMTVLERTREYGILRAVGTRPGQIFRLVLYEVTLMAAIGIMVGFALSLPANYLLSQHGVPMPQEFTYGGVEFTHYYAEVNAHSFYIPALTVLLAALLISIFPAAKAARVAPAQALRTH